MHMYNWLHIVVLIAFYLLSAAYAIIDPVTLAGLGITVGFGAIGGLYQYAKCKAWECCHEPWLKTNVSSDAGRLLRAALQERVYGQHIAIDLVTTNVYHHLVNEPTKSLVLSFHGATGVGKTHVARVLAETMFKKGMDSNYVHLIHAARDFPMPEQASQYRVKLQEWIQGNLTKCSKSLFIFDEVDKIPAGVLDGLSSFLDYKPSVVHGADPRGAIFIFLSNTGKERIDKTTYEAWEAGRTRESLALSDFQKDVQKHAYNENTDNGLFHSDVINRELIDIYVPFLPLVREHVEACSRDYLREHGYVASEDVAVRVAAELEYYPPGEGGFSTTGCKRVRERVVGFGSKLRKIKREESARSGDL